MENSLVSIKKIAVYKCLAFPTSIYTLHYMNTRNVKPPSKNYYRVEVDFRNSEICFELPKYEV